MIRKAAGASLLISFGVYALLKTGYSPLAMILFSLGLYAICRMGLALFTGKCGFVVEQRNPAEVLEALGVNLAAGYILGMAFHSSLGAEAADVVAGWSVSWEYLLRSALCGAIMYLAVKLDKMGTPVGILMGVPLFLTCGFQHSIANVVIMGAALKFHPALAVCVAGNWAGALVMWWLTKSKKGGQHEVHLDGDNDGQI